MAEFRMPSLGSDMERGTLVEWHVRPGDQVHRGDIVAVVETDKGAMDVEIFEAGVIEALLVAPGTEVPVGAVLATLRAEGEAAAAAPSAPAPAPAATPQPEAPPAVPAGPSAPAPTTRRAVSPAARRRAGELGLTPDALATLAGSGPGGALTTADVERAAASPAAPPPPPAPGAGLRQAIAAAMARAKREIPHYYLAATLDFEPALRLIEARNAGRPPAQRLLPAALLVRAVACAAHEVPDFNGHYRDGAFVPAPSVHLGFAVALRGGGVVAPAVHDADGQDLDAVMAALRDLSARARGGRLRASEHADPTITLSSLGDLGVEAVYPIIHPPQVAIVGFGAPVTRPWVVDGAVTARRVITATLAADHRVSDGQRGARFLAAVVRLLESPEQL